MQDPDYELVIGDKRWSSWSLRPWVLMQVLGIPFRETMIRLRWEGTTEEIARHSPSARVPLLKDGALLVWDSLAIIEYLADAHPGKGIWPEAREARAIARSISAEMHSGFYSMRDRMPMDFLTVHAASPPEEKVAADIRRIVAIWSGCRRDHGAGGDFLFGPFCAADAMYAPVATRFRSYGVNLADFGDDGTAARYAETLLALPEMALWGQGAALERDQEKRNPVFL